MSLYINTRGEQVAAVKICDRCKMKRLAKLLVPDPNSPGLQVCSDGCVDVYDPWRLAPRMTEDITVKGVRPEEAIVNSLTYTINYTALAGVFTPGEQLLGTQSQTQQTLVSAAAGVITYTETQDARVYTVGEIVVGLSSGATGTINSTYGAS